MCLNELFPHSSRTKSLFQQQYKTSLYFNEVLVIGSESPCWQNSVQSLKNKQILHQQQLHKSSAETQGEVFYHNVLLIEGKPFDAGAHDYCIVCVLCGG